MKVPNSAEKFNQLWNDCRIHKAVEEAFECQDRNIRAAVSIPRWMNWVATSEPSARNGFKDFLPESLEHTRGFVSGRIHAMPPVMREALFECFAPKALRNDKEAILNQPDNQDCLIRLYLGRHTEREPRSSFRLRNFDMTVNEMEHIGLNTTQIAENMAKVLAMLHWSVSIDADDVEFVLGRVPRFHTAPRANQLNEDRLPDETVVPFDLEQCKVGIWLLDFNQCKRVLPEEDDEDEVIKQLVKSFFFNDPYYPRPAQTDESDMALWNAFKTAYLRLTGIKMPRGKNHMAAQFIEAVEAEGRRRAAGSSLFQ